MDITANNWLAILIDIKDSMRWPMITLTDFCNSVEWMNSILRKDAKGIFRRTEATMQIGKSCSTRMKGHHMRDNQSGHPDSFRFIWHSDAVLPFWATEKRNQPFAYKSEICTVLFKTAQTMKPDIHTITWMHTWICRNVILSHLCVGG